jgi:hypothetical protein
MVLLLLPMYIYYIIYLSSHHHMSTPNTLILRFNHSDHMVLLEQIKGWEEKGHMVHYAAEQHSVRILNA